MENLVLYRKYRPQTLAEIVGQEHVKKVITNSLAQNKVAHAYLFSGPRGSGKTTIARILAKSLNCANLSRIQEINSADKLSIRRSLGEGGQDIPCNSCENCLEFNSGRSLDLIEIDAASNRGIDEIKNLRENVRFGPTTGKYKVYLIDEAHMLTKEAFNAFLKTLEEPPAHAIFILATTEPHRLLPTIISRTQRFDFKRLSLAELSERLQTVAKKEDSVVETEALKLIAHEADGSVRDAESLLGQIIATGENHITLEKAETILGLFSHKKIRDFVDLILAADSAGALGWFHKNVEAGYDITQLLKSLNHYLRKMVLISASPDLFNAVKLELGEEQASIIKSQAQKTNSWQLVHWLKTFGEAKKNLELYPAPQMAMELALVGLLENKSPVAVKLVAQPTLSSDKTNKSDETNIGVAKPAIDLNALIDHWPKVIQEVRPHNHSLSGFIQGMKLKEVAGATLVLSTKYVFNKERISEAKNKKIIEEAIQKVLGSRLSIDCILEK